MDTEELFIDGQTLPDPLDRDELYCLLEKMEQGDDFARDKLVEHNIRLVLHQVVGKFRFVDYDKKDLVSIGNIGLIKAIDTFDRTRKIEFSTYATRCIDNEILMFIRKINRDKVIQSFESTVCSNVEDSQTKIKDILRNEGDFVEEYIDNECYNIIMGMIEKLPKRDQDFIFMNFGFYDGKEYTQNEIAEKYNISQSYVSMKINRDIRKIVSNLKTQNIVENNKEKRKRKVKVYE